MTADFLLELLSEEIPARMQERARADLARLFADEIAKAGLAAAAIETFATPRRLALIARDLPLVTQPVASETKGPRASAPPQALDGFLRKTGLTREQLVERDGVLFAIVEQPGRATADVLADAIPAIVRAFPWPKSMRWGAASAETTSLRWVRPLQGIVALLGEDVVPFAVEGVRSGAATLGHRFHHPGQITIGSAADYAEKLRMCHVLVHPEERRAIIRERCATLAAEAGLTVVPDEALVAENAGLTEWPVPLLGHFDPAFLEVPREVIQLTLRTNQKYFVLNDAEGRLAPAFLCTANIEAKDGGLGVVAGNRKVLSARLSDARFFWDQDRKVPLAKHAEKLADIVFHEKLGTVADKVERVAKLARWLVEEGIVPPAPSPQRGEGSEAQPSPAPSAPLTQPSPQGERALLADLAEQAARLCKADLVTGMVGEFPELQGVIGGYYARAEGLPAEVADAIRDHYKPVGQGDEVPTAPVTVAVSLADKLDTLVLFFALGLEPTGSKDPFALRRATLADIALTLVNQLRFSLQTLVTTVFHLHQQILLTSRWRLFEAALGKPFRELVGQSGAIILSSDGKRLSLYSAPNELVVAIETPPELELVHEVSSRLLEFQFACAPLIQFFADRLKIQQREAGVRHDLIDAVFALGGEDDLVRLLARVKALQAFVGTREGADLLAGYRRAANILRKEGWEGAPSPRRGEGWGEGEFGVDHAPHGRGSSGGRSGPELGAAGRQASDGGNPHPDPLPEGEGAENSLSYTPEKAETALLAALDAAGPLAAQAVEAENFAGAMAALATLRAPIDAFFETVTVNDPDPAKRAARLALLARIRDAVHRVADFSKIEG